MKIALVHDYLNLGGNWLLGQSNHSRLVDKSQYTYNTQAA